MAKKKAETEKGRFEMRMSDDLKKRATIAAKADGRTLAGYITHLLEKSLSKP